MNILTQILKSYYSTVGSTPNSTIEGVLDRLISPIYQNPSTFNYADLIESLGKHIRDEAIYVLKETLERMDYEYRHSKDRTQIYYVKQTRTRTLMTVFGELTYKRTEYQDRITKELFCYVDWKLGIRKRDRFDMCVQSLIIEGYADHNSMIKVGKIIGDRINGVFNTDPQRDTAISRQTVYNILHRFGIITPPIKPRVETPEVLYIIADEKFIPLQYRKSEKTKEMIKALLIYEGKEIITRKNGTFTKRSRLINPFRVINNGKKFWEKVQDVLHKLYDMDKVKLIYLMGDGASWISNGVFELRSSNTSVRFAIDGFHYNQAINHITTDPELRKMLRKYAYHNMKNDFELLVERIIENSPQREVMIREKLAYIIKHWFHFQTLVYEVNIGCPAEQLISHDIASVFTSVPKAYSEKNINTYLNNRMLFRNGYDLRTITIQAMSLSSDNRQDVIIPDQTYDFSIFDRKTYDINPLAFLNNDVITKF